jgi:hypothetical protein
MDSEPRIAVLARATSYFTGLSIRLREAMEGCLVDSLFLGGGDIRNRNSFEVKKKVVSILPFCLKIFWHFSISDLAYSVLNPTVGPKFHFQPQFFFFKKFMFFQKSFSTISENIFSYFCDKHEPTPIEHLLKPQNRPNRDDCLTQRC